ncbi:MAG: GNAT family N-acetyltransferase [Nitrososphaerota archaeon]|jgi:cystathionine beta-lyase|nr:GNAT family N-acetyltransferase [Nitrososphaerota archaeon]
MIRTQFFHDLTDEIAQLRREVFIIEQGISEIDEFEGGEDTFVHICVFECTELVGYIRVRIDGKQLRIGRAAIVKNKRRQGLGSNIMREAENYGRSLGCILACLNAQVQAKKFYEYLGYSAREPVFIEAGIPHIKMEKTL